MVIISESNQLDNRRYGNTQMRYSMLYVLITFAVLFFLNVYSSNIIHTLISHGKESSMMEKALLAAAEINSNDVVNTATITSAINSMDNLRVSRLIVTDHAGKILYDSLDFSNISNYALFPEIFQALQGNDVFTWFYHDGTMESKAAVPILSYGTMIGSVYMTELDTTQGVLIASLQKNILTITLVLEAIVLLFSLAFSNIFSKRLRRILSSIRIIREGDYTHKVFMGGRDELTYLGNEFNDLTDRLQDAQRTQRQFVSDASH